MFVQSLSGLALYVGVLGVLTEAGSACAVGVWIRAGPCIHWQTCVNVPTGANVGQILASLWTCAATCEGYGGHSSDGLCGITHG